MNDSLVYPEWVWSNAECKAVDYRAEFMGAKPDRKFRGYRVRVFVPNQMLRDGGVPESELERRKAEALERTRDELHPYIGRQIEITGLWPRLLP